MIPNRWLEAFRSYLDIEASDNAILVEICLGAAFDACYSYTGLLCLIDDTDRTITFQGNGGISYLPPFLPVVSITSVKIGDETIPLSESYLTNGYFVDGRQIKLRGYCWSGWCEIEYKAGYDEDTMPNDLLLSCFEYAGTLYETKSHLGVSSKNFKDANLNYLPSSLSQSVKEVWDRYRVIRID